MEITFLGTACMAPTKERNTSAVFLTYKSEGILFDCGEGTQRQMKIAGIPLTKITKILMSHWHGDHILGLPGLMQTLASQDPNKTIEIYGPKGIGKYLDVMFSTIAFEATVRKKIVEVEDGIFFDGKDFCLEARRMKHRIPCVSFAFLEKDKRRIEMDKAKKLGIPEGPLIGDLQDGKTITFKGKKITPEQVSHVIKGRKIAFVTDTEVVQNCYKIAEDADLLICESVYASKLKDKAEEYGHMTSAEAALIASKSNVKKLVLTHFSARYKNTQEIEEDARTIFDNVVCANDFMRMNL